MNDTRAARATRFLVSGRVQGVGFRYFTRGVAQRLGLVGWVKNLPTGEVEVRVAGVEPALEQLRHELRRGPRGARVDALAESPLEASHDWSSFRIEY